MNFWDFLRFFGIFGFFDHFWQFFDFWGFCMDFLDFFWFFLFFFIFWDFFGFLDFFKFLDFLNFLGFCGFFLGFFLFFFVSFKVTKVTTKCYHGYYWTPTIAKNGPKQHKELFFARRAKKASAQGRSPPQELEVGLRSGLYLLVFVVKGNKVLLYYCTNTVLKLTNYLCF